MQVENRIGATARIAANVSLVVLSLTLTLVLLKTYFLPPGFLQPANAPAGVLPRKTDLSSLGLPGGDNVVMFLRVGCGFCTKSAPLYQGIVEQARGSNRHVVAVFPGKREEALAYLNSLDLRIEDVRQAPFDSLGVTGTPTLVLSRNGEVTAVWRGLQPDSDRAKILATLFQP